MCKFLWNKKDRGDKKIHCKWNSFIFLKKCYKNVTIAFFFIAFCNFSGLIKNKNSHVTWCRVLFFHTVSNHKIFDTSILVQSEKTRSPNFDLNFSKWKLFDLLDESRDHFINLEFPLFYHCDLIFESMDIFW